MKANRRWPTLQAEQIRRALIRIAKSFPAAQPLANRQPNWVAQRPRWLRKNQAAFLFDEAPSVWDD